MIAERILKIIEYIGVNQAQFTQMIDLNPSILSHIIKGRNKPSLEVVEKILKTFPQISPDWLLWGNGDIARDSDGERGKVIIREKVKNIERITVYYEDDTFCDFYPKKRE